MKYFSCVADGRRERATSLRPMSSSSTSTRGGLETGSPRPRAGLVGVQLPGVLDADHPPDLAELRRLAPTPGFDFVAPGTQRRDALSAAAVLGQGNRNEVSGLP